MVQRPSGSSPRVRGTPHHSGAHDARERFIPACAGNPRPPFLLPAPLQVHPRVCGEPEATAGTLDLIDGSSPRVRGTQHTGGICHSRSRFIPACAGNPTVRPSSVEWKSVHPRVCGEPRVSGLKNLRDYGSSPRVRGTLSPHHGPVPRRRFIPACAGNPGPRALRSRGPSVHPRVCGEPMREESIDFLRHGSSPRVRGTQANDEQRLHRRRFIPACAGNPDRPTPLPYSLTVHPRVCGEPIMFATLVSRSSGSSPRVRGTPCERPSRGRVQRFIPACAGNPRSAMCTRTSRTVHPRVCGEPTSRHFAVSFSNGSSPRVRGTQPLRESRPVERRFIPACAGNPERQELRTRHPSVHPRVCGEPLYSVPRSPRRSGSSPRVRGTLR